VERTSRYGSHTVSEHGFERQLEQISNKDMLHRVIDELSDDDKVLVLVSRPERNSYYTFNRPTYGTLVYMVESFKHNHVFACTCCEVGPRPVTGIWIEPCWAKVCPCSECGMPEECEKHFRSNALVLSTGRRKKRNLPA
jgi:hypothetical protein